MFPETLGEIDDGLAYRRAAHVALKLPATLEPIRLRETSQKEARLGSHSMLISHRSES